MQRLFVLIQVIFVLPVVALTDLPTTHDYSPGLNTWDFYHNKYTESLLR
jgi:hypothetical protein